MSAMKRILIAAGLMAMIAAVPALADGPLPDYLVKAQTLIGQAAGRAAEVKEFSDAVLIGQNYLRNAEAEYKNHLSWGGKLDAKAEPTVRYYATMAELQARLIISKAEKIALEKERANLEAQAAGVRGKIKIFDDKVAEIGALKAELAKRDAALKARETRLASMTADSAASAKTLSDLEARATAAAAELEVKKKALAELEQQSATLKQSLDAALKDNTRLKAELAALAAQKGAVESQSKEQIEALNRQKDFLDQVGKLGGVIKSGSDNMTVIFARSGFLKAPKNDTLTPEGIKTVARVAALLTAYPEYRVKVRVHGFGQGKAEDASATDRMARLIREAMIEKGKLDPAVIEALGAGGAEPIYPKNNPEGNRRVEITFIRK